MRKHLSPATVLATVALFVSLSGTAAASVIISSNHQVRAHVIAGANAPKGDNHNLIQGSVGSTDLHGNAVTAAKVKNGSLTGADLANGSVGYGKLKLPQISFSGTNTDPIEQGPKHTVLRLDDLTLGVACWPNAQDTVLAVYAQSATAGIIRGSYALGTDNTSTPPFIVDKNVTSTPIRFAVTENATLAGEFTYTDSNRVIALTLDGSDLGQAGTCDLHGVAVPAPN